MTKKKDVKENVIPTLISNDLITSINGISDKTVGLYESSSKILFDNVIGMNLTTIPPAKSSVHRQEIEATNIGQEIVRMVSMLLKAKAYGMGETFEDCWKALLPTNIDGDKMALGKFRRGMRDNLDTHEEKEGIGEFSKAKQKARETAKSTAKTKNKENATDIVSDRIKKFKKDQVDWCKDNGVKNPEQFVNDLLTLSIEFEQVENQEERKQA